MHIYSPVLANLKIICQIWKLSPVKNTFASLRHTVKQMEADLTLATSGDHISETQWHLVTDQEIHHFSCDLWFMVILQWARVVNARHWINAGLMFAHRFRSSFKPTREGENTLLGLFFVKNVRSARYVFRGSKWHKTSIKGYLEKNV